MIQSEVYRIGLKTYRRNKGTLRKVVSRKKDGTVKLECGHFEKRERRHSKAKRVHCYRCSLNKKVAIGGEKTDKEKSHA